MRGSREVFFGAILIAAALASAAIPRGSVSAQMAQSAEPVPAFHSTLPDGPLPETLAPAEFSNALVQNAYAVAAKVKKVLYQQPCYCHCDRSAGHGSLLDCFVSRHAAVCDVCIREGIYSYEQTRKGKTPAQIRSAIKDGEWKNVDLTKYQTYPAKP